MNQVIVTISMLVRLCVFATIVVGDAPFSASKITDKWKTRLTVGATFGSNSYETKTYNFTESTEIRKVNGLFVGCINDYWSLCF